MLQPSSGGGAVSIAGVGSGHRRHHHFRCADCGLRIASAAVVSVTTTYYVIQTDAPGGHGLVHDLPWAGAGHGQWRGWPQGGVPRRRLRLWRDGW